MAELEKNLWPGWETIRIIGRGSFGAVYEIRRDVFGHTEKAALKVISIPQNSGDIEELYNDGYDKSSITQRFESYLRDIVREYSLMAEMKGHTNVVYCDDLRYVQHDDGMGWDIYIKMELLTPLTKALNRNITEGQVLKLALDMCNALILCKNKNIIHRDIKPQNIFVSEDGHYKLGDFGIAKTAERTTSGTKTGTYKYMAPEVYNNQPYGTAADIYSLGLVLYWLLNERRTPFVPLPPRVPTSAEEDLARSRRFSGEKIPAPARGSAALKRIVLKACAYDPRDRYASAADMKQELEALLPELDPDQTVLAAPAAPMPGQDRTQPAHTGFVDRTQAANMTMDNRTQAANAGYDDRTQAADMGYDDRTQAAGMGYDDRTQAAGMGYNDRTQAAGMGYDDRTQAAYSRPERVSMPRQTAPGSNRNAPNPLRMVILALALIAVIGLGLFAILRGDSGEEPDTPETTESTPGTQETTLPPAETPEETQTVTTAATEAPTVPMETAPSRSILGVDGGLDHTVVLYSDGTVASIGSNAYGQCNTSDWTDIVQISSLKDHTVGVKSDGTVVATGANTYGQCNVSGWTDVIAVSAGEHHTVGLRSDGTVVAVGSNLYGECNVTWWTDVVAIGTAYTNTIGLCSDGSVYVTGSYSKGKIGGWSNIVDISASDSHFVGLCSDGTVRAVGTNNHSQCELSGWYDIVEISAGCAYTTGVRSDGTVVVQGINDRGQHEARVWTDIVDIATGLEHTIGIRSDGTLIAVGANDHGQCDVSQLNP